MAQQASVGDLQNNIRKLEKTLRAVRYGPEIDFAGLAKGLAGAYMPLYDYLFTSYQRNFAERLCSEGIELSGKVDAAFMKAVYKALRDIFGYKPPITVEQFFSKGYVERKVIMAAEIADIVCKHYPPPSASGLPIRPKGNTVTRPQSAGDAKQKAAGFVEAGINRASSSSSLDADSRDQLGSGASRHPAAFTRRTAIAGRPSGPRAATAASGAANVVSVVARDVAFQDGVIRSRAAPASAVATAASRPPASRRCARTAATAESSASSQLEEGFDGDVPGVRVQRERAALSSTHNPEGCGASETIAFRQLCGQRSASDALVGGDVGAATGSAVSGSAEAAAIAEVASTMLKSLESVHQRLRVMEGRLDALSVRISGSSDPPPGGGDLSASVPIGDKQLSALSAENLEARVVLLESRLSTLGSTVNRLVASSGSVTTGSGRTLSPSQDGSAAAATPSDGEAVAVRATTVIAADHLLPAAADRYPSCPPLPPSASHAISADISFPTDCLPSDRGRCGGSLGLSMPGAEHDEAATTVPMPLGGHTDDAGLSSPSSTSGTSTVNDPGVVSPLSLHDTCALATPDRAKVNHIAQMLEGTMKMLMGK